MRSGGTEMEVWPCTFSAAFDDLHRTRFVAMHLFDDTSVQLVIASSCFVSRM